MRTLVEALVALVDVVWAWVRDKVAWRVIVGLVVVGLYVGLLMGAGLIVLLVRWAFGMGGG